MHTCVAEARCRGVGGPPPTSISRTVRHPHGQADSIEGVHMHSSHLTWHIGPSRLRRRPVLTELGILLSGGVARPPPWSGEGLATSLPPRSDSSEHSMFMIFWVVSKESGQLHVSARHARTRLRNGLLRAGSGDHLSTVPALPSAGPVELPVKRVAVPRHTARAAGDQPAPRELPLSRTRSGRCKVCGVGYGFANVK